MERSRRVLRRIRRRVRRCLNSVASCCSCTDDTSHPEDSYVAVEHKADLPECDNLAHYQKTNHGLAKEEKTYQLWEVLNCAPDMFQLSLCVQLITTIQSSVFFVVLRTSNSTTILLTLSTVIREKNHYGLTHGNKDKQLLEGLDGPQDVFQLSLCVQLITTIRSSVFFVVLRTSNSTTILLTLSTVVREKKRQDEHRNTELKKTTDFGNLFRCYPKPMNAIDQDIKICVIRKTILELNHKSTNNEIYSKISKACGVPRYWAAPMLKCSGAIEETVNADVFISFWIQMNQRCTDDAEKFTYIVSSNNDKWSIIPEDFRLIIHDLLFTHPQLSQIPRTYGHHNAYFLVVTNQIFFYKSYNWSVKMTTEEIRRSGLLEEIRCLEHYEFKMPICFSSENFLVIYNTFFDLDKDGDFLLQISDFETYNEETIPPTVLNRIFSSAILRGSDTHLMTFSDFVWFISADEGKDHPKSIEYWFRVLDLNGDGALSLFELEYFFEEQNYRMEILGVECPNFQYLSCQLLDMIRPKLSTKFSLQDFKFNVWAPCFFDLFCNTNKCAKFLENPYVPREDDEHFSRWESYVNSSVRKYMDNVEED